MTTAAHVMKAVRILIATAVACTAGFFTEFRVEHIGDQGPRVSLGVSQAEAQYVYRGRGMARRSVRRTSRRTSRRVARRHAVLPAGCPLAGLYHYCGGVYYQPVVESGKTVYVVVTP
jgi:hypothetical protein